MKLGRLLTFAAIGLLAFALPVSAGATVKREGAWPATEKRVDLEVDGPPSEALKSLAREAGWSLVLQDGAAIDRAGSDVHVAVDGQPADAVLEALFVGRDVVAHRAGPLVTISAASIAGQAQPPPVPVAAAPVVPITAPTVASPSPSPFPTARGEDREVVGTNLVIRDGEIVHNVTVTGGSAVVKGTVTGDLVVTGGSATVRKGAHVVGDATVLGGKLRVENGARVDGAVHVTGGSIERDDGPSSSREPSAADEHDARRPSRLAAAASAVGKALTRASLLFVLGCVLMALLTSRMERLRVEVAARPMRSFALGLVGTIAGSVALAVLFAVLCITIIGIPVALALGLGLVLALYGSVTSVLTTFGAAIIGHRTDNPYLHLLLGCGAFLVATCIPWIGGAVSFVVMMVALGALLATRGAGFFEKKKLLAA